MSKKEKHSKESIVKFIEATLVNNINEHSAFKQYINPHVKNVSSALSRFKRSEDYLGVYKVLYGDDQVRMKESVARVKQKYVNLIEKNIDTMEGIFEDVAEQGYAEKAKAVRLANETINAMSLVDQPTQANQDDIDTTGMVLL